MLARAADGAGVDPADSSQLGWGRAAVGMRYGLSDALDVGGRVSTFGAELSGKVRRVKSEDSPWVVSLAPVVGVHPFVLRVDAHPEYGEQRYAAVPVLVGLDTGGGALGYAFRLGSQVRPMPEVAAMVPVGALPAASESRADGASPHVQLGLAFRRDGGGR